MAVTCGTCQHWQLGTTPSGARLWQSGFGQCSQRLYLQADKQLARASYEPRSRACRFTPPRWTAKEQGDD